MKGLVRSLHIVQVQKLLLGLKASLSGHGLCECAFDVDEGQKSVGAAHAIATDDIGEHIGEISLEGRRHSFLELQSVRLELSNVQRPLGGDEEIVLAPERDGRIARPAYNVARDAGTQHALWSINLRKFVKSRLTILACWLRGILCEQTWSCGRTD